MERLFNEVFAELKNLQEERAKLQAEHKGYLTKAVEVEDKLTVLGLRFGALQNLFDAYPISYFEEFQRQSESGNKPAENVSAGQDDHLNPLLVSQDIVNSRKV